MENILSRPQIRCLLALICCALWGSAFPCIKTGYEWLHITTVGSQILFAGYRFFMAGIVTFAVGCIVEKRIIKIKRGIRAAYYGNWFSADDRRVCVLLHRYE
ncbi:MAG: hypothetical protein Q4C46_08465 [Bacillota bacterium]|nr:hypothetical protein [Bacillota bacterium]